MAKIPGYRASRQNKNHLLIESFLSIDGIFSGGPKGTRTPDLLNANYLDNWAKFAEFLENKGRTGTLHIIQISPGCSISPSGSLDIAGIL